MKKRTRILSCLFAFLFIISAILPSCGEGQTAETEAAATTVAAADTTLAEETSEALAALDVKDLEKYEFNVLWPSVHQDGHFLHNEIDCDDENGDSIDSAVYARNARVETDYNITINADTEWCSSIATKIKTYWSAGDTPYDAFCAPIAMVTNQALEGICADFNDMAYYNEEQQWWDHGIMSEFAIAGHKYFGTGDIIYSDNFYPYTIFVNTEMYEVYRFSDDLYDLVRQKKWTIEKLMEMCKVCPNSSDDVWDYNDTYGILVNANMAKAMYYAAGKQTVEFADDGTPTWVMTTENVTPILEKALELFHSGNMAYNTSDDIGHNIPGKTHAQTAITMFTAGQALFYAEELIVTERMTKSDSSLKYSLVPIPLMNDNQDRYYCVMNDAVVVCVPENQDLEKVSLVLSAMGKESVDTLTEAFFGIVLNYKYVSDANSQEMLNLVLDSAKAPDAGTILGWGNLVSTYKALVQNNQSDFASAYKKAEKLIKTSIKKYVALLNK